MGGGGEGEMGGRGKGGEGRRRGGGGGEEMGEDLRLRQGGMLPKHSAILPLEQKSESFLDKGIGSQATYILDLTQATYEVMASVLSKVTHNLLTPDWGEG
jgi:hypothetical protein